MSINFHNTTSHIDFRVECIMITLAGGGGGVRGCAINNDALKFKKVIEFDSSLYLSNYRWKQVIYQLRK